MTERLDHYCTMADSGFAASCLALCRSLARHCRPHVLWLLALDPETEQIFSRLRLPGLRIVSLHALERFAPTLPGVKRERTLREYYFTIRPFWLDYLLAENPAIEHLVYLDADLFFFADAAPINDAARDHAVGVTPHGFQGKDAEAEIRKAGAFNAGWVSVSRNRQGLACLDEWKRQCFAWCYERAEGGKRGNQKYLDAWPQRYDTYICRHPGANLAVWNFAHTSICAQGNAVTVDGEPLIFYHFSQLKQYGDWLFSPSYLHPRLPRALRDRVYRPYLAALRQAEAEVAAVMPARAMPPRRAPARSLGVILARALRFARAIAGGHVHFVRGLPLPGATP